MPMKEFYKKVGNDFNEDITRVFHTIPRDLDELTDQQLEGILAPTCRFYFLVKYGFCGIFNMSANGLKSTWGKKDWNTLLYDKELFLGIHKYLSSRSNDIKFYHGDYAQFLTMCRAEDFIFLDPPYYNPNFDQTVRVYSTGLFDSDSQQKLAEECKELVDKKCYVMQTNSDYDKVIAMYRKLGFTINKESVFRSVKKTWATEIVITSYTF